MNSILTNQQSRLVKFLCANGKDKKEYLSEKAMQGKLSSAEVDTVCELISNEIMIKGIEDTFEPNEYGKELGKH